MQRATVAAHSDRLTALEQSVGALQLRRPAGGGGQGGVEEGEFIPAFVELEGWTTWADRGDSGVTREQAEAHVGVLRERAPAGLREHLGRIVLFQHLNGKIRLPVGDGRAREFQDWALRAYATGAVDPISPGAEMRVRLQKRPAQRLNQERFLRGLRAVEAQVRILARDPAWQGGRAAPVWRTFSVAVGEVEVGTLSREGDWTWHAAGLRLLQLQSGAQLLAGAPGRP